MKKFLVSASSFLLPVLTFAQAVDVSKPNVNITNAGLQGAFAQINAVINYVVPFLVGIAVLVVIYGIFGFVTSAGDEEARAGAKQYIIWGVIGIFLMLSVWGLVTILENTFFLQKNNQGIVTPKF